MPKNKPGREIKKPKQPPKPRPPRRAPATDSRFYELRNALYDGDLSLAHKLYNEAAGVIHLRNGIGETVLHFLAVENHQEGVAWLLGKGADINTRNDFDASPLMEAASLGYLPLCRFLLDNGASLAFVDHIGQSVLSIAARKAYKKNDDDLALLSLLLKHATPADIAASRDGITFINEILTYGSSALTALLRQHGFVPDDTAPAP